MSMALPTTEVNATFDGFTQPFIILLPDGVTEYQTNLGYVGELQRNQVYQAVSQGTMIGATLMLLLAMIIMTRPDKRKSLVFAFNAMALLFVALRGIFASITLNGPFYNFYRWELAYYQGISRQDQAISASTEALSFLLTLAIELSLIMQVRIVCCNLRTWHRMAINIPNGIIATAAVAVRFALMVINMHWNILNTETLTQSQFDQISKLAEAANIVLVVSIGVSATVFCTKLFLAIRSRRSMGMTQFGPVQIIFVVGCQTLLTPLIFTIAVYFGVKANQIRSFVPTVVAISLPLSAMWATANTNHSHIAQPEKGHRAFPLGASDFESSRKGSDGGSRKEKSAGYSENTQASTLVNDERAGLTSPRNKTRCKFSTPDTDLEMQKMGAEGVHVSRTYSVRSD